jgi:hypothetical protein
MPEIQMFPVTPGLVQSANVVGAPNAAIALDLSSASWVQFFFSALPSICDIAFPNPDIPPNAMIYGIAPLVGYDSGVGTLDFFGSVVSNGVFQTSFHITGGSWTGVTFHTGSYITSSPSGQAWSDTEADTFFVRLSSNHNSTTEPRILVSTVFIKYYNQPAVSNVGPTPSTNFGRPTIFWSFTGDTLPQAWYHVKVFSQAQYNAPGFSPDTSNAVWDSNIVPSSFPNRQIDVELTDGHYRWYVRAAQNVAGRQHWSEWAFAQSELNRPPSTPNLISPASGSKQDLSQGPLLVWEYNHPSFGEQQASFAIRRKTTGAYEYWNHATQSWSVTEIWNAVPNAFSYDFPPGSWPNGPTYFWSVNTRDPSAQQSGYANDFSLEGDAPPSVTLTGPAAIVEDTTRPFISWSYTDPDGDPQEQYHVKVYTALDLFLGNEEAVVWDSGVNAGAEAIKQVAVHLQNLETYVALVRAFADGQWSVWTPSTPFQIDLTPPQAPGMTVTLEELDGRVKIDLLAHNNLLTDKQSDFETGVAGWEVEANTVLDQSQAQAFHGVSSLRLTRDTTAAAMIVRTSQGGSGVRVFSGITYTAWVRMRASATGRTCQLSIVWFDENGAVLSTTSASSITDSTAVWTPVSVQALAPAGATYAALRVTVLAPGSGEQHYLDGAFFGPGTVAQTSTWNKGGWLRFAYSIEYSDDGGVTWFPVRGAFSEPAFADQSFSVYDYEIIPRVERRYRAFTIAEV